MIDNLHMLYRPQWRQVEDDWLMIVGNRTVAVLIPNSCAVFPRYRWLSQIVCDELPDFGWDNVDFETLAIAQIDLENWWRHACLGRMYRP